MIFIYIIAELIQHQVGIDSITGRMPASLFYFQTILLLLARTIFPLMYMQIIYREFQQNTKEKLPLFQMIIYYVLCNVSINLFNGVVVKYRIAKDLWSFLFPISQTFLIGWLTLLGVVFLIRRYRSALLAIDKSLIRGLLVVSFFVGSVSGDLFNQPVAGMREQFNFSWLLFLFLFVLYCYKHKNRDIYGYHDNQFLLKKNSVLGWGVFFVIGFLSVILMKNVSYFMSQTYESTFRFITPTSVIPTLMAISLFLNFSEREPAYKNELLLFTTIVVMNVPAAQGLLIDVVVNKFPASTVFSFIKRFSIQLVMSLCIIIGLYILLTLLSRFGVENRLKKLIQLLVKNKKTIVFVTIELLIFSILITLAAAEKHQFVHVEERVNGYAQLFLKRPSSIFLSFLVLLALFIFIFGITNKLWIASAMSTMVTVILLIGVYLKRTMRADAFVFEDIINLKVIENTHQIIDTKTMFFLGSLLLVGIVIIFVTSYLLYRKRPVTQTNGKKMFTYTMLGLLPLVLFANAGVPNSLAQELVYRLDFLPDKKSALRQEQFNGAPLNFLYNLRDKVSMKQPDIYNESYMKKIVRKYQKKANRINKERNSWENDETVIFILSESYANPAKQKGVQISQPIMPIIDCLKKERIGGDMLSFTYGGGTANIEWATLTGLLPHFISNPEKVVPYTDLVSEKRNNISILKLFDKKIALHTFTADLYNRTNAYRMLGFDSFWNTSDKEHPIAHTKHYGKGHYISDDEAFTELMEKVEQTKGKSFFQLATMQNHAPYDVAYPDIDLKVEGPTIKDRASVENYAKGLYITDRAVKKLIDKIDRSKKPITLVFYGDHLPGIYEFKNSKEENITKYKTDYFVYSNKKNRREQRAHTKLVGTNSFIPTVLETANVKIPAYVALLQTVRDTGMVPVLLNGQLVFVNEESNQVEKREALTKETQKVYDEYYAVQYDLLYGNQYTKNMMEQ